MVSGMADLFQEEMQPAPKHAAQAAVLVPYPVDRAYDYALAEVLPPGSYVSVPLGQRAVPGIVWDQAAGDIDPAKIKNATYIYKDMPPLPDAHREFLNWMAGYVMSPLGAVLKLTLSVPKALEPEKPATGYVCANDNVDGLSPKARAVMEIAKDAQPRRAAELANEAGVSAGVVKTLTKNGYLREVDLFSTAPCRYPQAEKKGAELSKAQSDAAEILIGMLSSNPLPVGEREEAAQPPRVRGGYQKKPSQLFIQRSRELRQNQTDVEQKLWSKIRNEQFDVKFRRQHPIPPYIADFTCLEKKLIIELDGGQHADNPDDQKRTVFLESKGWRVLRFWNLEVVENLEGVLETIYNALQDTPSPQPSPHGGEGVKFQCVLLDGVTGAGKTEVYFEAVAQALRQDKQVLILLPEIALSNAFLDRFKSRFGCAPALWHSSLSPAQRRKTWRGVALGESKVVIGARSALFLPYADLGLIIVDEEHDPAYKQEEGVMYHARDMAVMRAKFGELPVVLVSATPSLETMQNVWDGKYGHVTLPERHGGAQMPDIHLIDMKTDGPEDRQHFIAPKLVDAAAQTMKDGGQVLFFLNRRGYAPLTLCRTCGHRFECPRCSAWMVEHRRTKRLHCHHCDYSIQIPDQCPACGDVDSLAPCGPGVERICEEVKDIFPDARVRILSSDTATTHDDLKKILDEIREHKVDIVIGTQIIAKGHHFPKLRCVGVVDADLGLSGGDLRATERTYQLLHQVAGRAGRESEKGHVYLQSFHPESRVMQALAANARDAFLEIEADERRDAFMPPFARLAGVIVSGREEKQVIEISQELGKLAPQGEAIQTLGPADAPMYKLRGRYRRRLLIRADKKIDLQKALAAWLKDVKTPSTVRVQIDIDPQSFF